MRVLSFILIFLFASCSGIESPEKRLVLRSISSEGNELFMIPDNVEANGNLAKEIKIEEKKTKLYILSPSELKKVPTGTVLFHKNTGERVTKKKSMEKGWQSLDYGFIREQLPEHRKWVEETDSYPRVGEHPSEIVKRQHVPDKFNIDVPNINMAVEEPDRIYPLSPKQLRELPLGTEIHRYSTSFGSDKGSIKTTHIGVEVIDLFSDFEGETNWGVKIHQIPAHRFDSEGYFIPYRKKPVGKLTVKPAKRFKFSIEKSALNPAGERVYFLSKADFDSLSKGAVLYHPNGTKYLKGIDSLPKSDARVAGGKFMKLGYLESQLAPSQIDSAGRSLFDRHYGKLKIGYLLDGGVSQNQSSCASLAKSILLKTK